MQNTPRPNCAPTHDDAQPIPLAQIETVAWDAWQASQTNNPSVTWDALTILLWIIRRQDSAIEKLSAQLKRRHTVAPCGFPPIGEEPFNASAADIEQAWREM
jgi:hypothetical protein